MVFHRIFLMFCHLGSLFLPKPFCFLFPRISHSSTAPSITLGHVFQTTSLDLLSMLPVPLLAHRIESTLWVRTLFWSFPMFSPVTGTVITCRCLLNKQAKGLTEETFKMSHRISCHHLLTGLTLISPLPTLLTHMKTLDSRHSILECLS